MFCQKCGAELKAGDAFCPSCGAKVEVASVPAAAKSAADALKNMKGFDFMLKPQRIVTLIGAAIALISCFLPYMERYVAGIVADQQIYYANGDIGTRTLMQEGGIAIFALAVSVGILVFKKRRFAYRVVAAIAGIVAFVLSVVPEVSESRKYVHTKALSGASVLRLAAVVIIVGLIMDIANSRKNAKL